MLVLTASLAAGAAADVGAQSLSTPATDGSQTLPGDHRSLVVAPADDPDSPSWRSAINDSLRMLLIQHGTRTALQSKTRRELAGPFFKDYQRSLKLPRTWGDGDGWLANYVGHPLQGAASGFIWVANDPKSRREEFGFSRRYWTTRWRALAWSTAYSVQFEIGPFSEASIGNVGLNPKTIGWTDHIVTPIGGTAVLVGEDALDKFLIRRLERGTRKQVLRATYRIVLNPARSFANVARGEAPWHRDTRPLRHVEPRRFISGATGAAGAAVIPDSCR